MAATSKIADQIRTALAEDLKRDVSGIELRHNLREDLGLDSLALIELLFKVEEVFDLEIPDSDLQKFITVGDVVQYVEDKLKSAPAPQGAHPEA